MPKFDRDRFDDVPADLDRVGAHRAEKRPGSGWIAFAWAALAVGVLVGAGVVYLGVANNSFQFVNPSTSGSAEAEAPETETETETETTAPAPTPSVTPLTDPSQVDASVTTITVLNGTATAGLAGSASDRLESAGWVVGTQGNASERVETSTVYYSAAEDEAAALGLAERLGITDVESSDAFPGAAVTIVLGSDYSA